MRMDFGRCVQDLPIGLPGSKWVRFRIRRSSFIFLQFSANNGFVLQSLVVRFACIE